MKYLWILKKIWPNELSFSFKVSETEGASLAASHGVGFCEVSVAENSPNLYKIFEKLLIESRARPVKPRKFSVSKMIGTLIGNNVTRQPLVNQGTVVPCNKGELNKSRVLKRRQQFTATASLWPTADFRENQWVKVLLELMKIMFKSGLFYEIKKNGLINNKSKGCVQFEIKMMNE